MDWLRLATEICHPLLSAEEIVGLARAKTDRLSYERMMKEAIEAPEICEGCKEPIEDYGDPYQMFEGPLCVTCYREMIND